MKYLLICITAVSVVGCRSVQTDTFVGRDNVVRDITYHHHTGLNGRGTTIVREDFVRGLSNEQIVALENELIQRMIDSGEWDESKGEPSHLFTETEVLDLRRGKVLQVLVKTQAGAGLWHDVVHGVSSGASSGITGGLIGADDVRVNASANSSSNSNSSANASQ